MILTLVRSILLIIFACFAVSAEQDQKSSNDEKTQIKDGQKRGTARSPLFLALESALRNNKELNALEKDVAASHENYPSTSSAFRPTISANTKYRKSNSTSWSTLGRANNQNDPDYDTENNTRSDMSSFGVDVRQNLFRCGADVAALKEVSTSLKAKWSALEAKKQSVLRDVAIAYFAIISKKEEILHLGSLLDSRRESVDVAMKMFEAGTSKELDVYQANAAYAETESKLAKAEAEYVSYCAQFEEMSGIQMPQNPTAPEKFFDDSIDEVNAIELAYKYNPSILSAVDAAEAAREAIKKVNIEFSPSVDLTYSFDHSYDPSTKKPRRGQMKIKRKDHVVTLSCTVPIYDGGHARAEKRKLEKTALKAVYEKEKAMDDVKSEVKSVWASLKAAKQNIDSAKKAVELREKALGDTLEEYKAGVKIMKDVLEAQEQLFEAKSMHIQAMNQYSSSQCRANALIGRMNPKYLRIRDSEYNYKADFARTKMKF
jgi:outer membrane protein TolC